MTNPLRWSWKGWLSYFGLWTTLALFFASQAASQALLYPGEANPLRWRMMMAQSFVNWYTWGLLTLGILWVTQRVPLTRARVWQAIPVYAALGIACVVIRTSVNWGFSLVSTYFGHSGLRERLISQAHWNIFVYAVVLGGVIALEYYRKYREREVRTAQLETRLAQAQLQVLRMQLQPHFLFNTLHGISTLMHRDVEAADTMLTQLSELLRIVMTSEGEQETTLKREMDFLERYVEIQQTRFGERLHVHMDIQPEALDAMVPTLVLQPLVENAIRHAVAPRAAGGWVSVSVKRENGSLNLEVRDDGPGLRRNAALGNGVGLRNTRARLEQLYGGGHRMEMTNEPGGGLAIRLTIPFRTAPAEQPVEALA